MANFLSAKTIFLLIGLFALSMIWGCKDSELTDDASLLEQCKLYLDEGEWSDAIDVCTDAGGDEGYHYAAQAYMGQGGLSLLNLVKTMTTSSDSSGAATAIFSFIPETEEQKTSFKKALDFLMGTSISNKSQTVYLEALLVSSILVFKELENVFGLTESDGTFTTCDIDVTDDADPAKCTRSIDVSGDGPVVVTFSGLGSDFYTNLCCNLDSASCTAVDSTFDNNNDGTVAYDVIIDSCSIEAHSVLQYNKNAFDSFDVTDAFKDSGGNNVLAPLDFYTFFDSGNSFSASNASGDEYPLCRAALFPDITSNDQKLIDCEIIGAMFDSTSDIF